MEIQILVQEILVNAKERDCYVWDEHNSRQKN